MILYENFTEFNQDSIEGKLLLSALAILTSIDEIDIKTKKYGGYTHPDDAFKQVVELANKIYYEFSWTILQSLVLH